MTTKKKAAINRALSIVRKYFPEVNKVSDAKASLSIEVTKHDDQVATKKAHKGCAMAVACKRKLNLDGVIISVKTAYMIKGNKAIRFRVPERVSREVVSFDRGGGFEPGKYKLNKPDTPLGEAHSGKSGPSSTHKATKQHVLTKNIRTVLGSEVE